MTVLTATPELQLPWEVSRVGDRRFRRMLSVALLLFLPLAIGVPLVDLPELVREQEQETPPHLARIILEKQTLPEPEPVKPKPKPKPEPEPVKPKPEPVKPTERQVAEPVNRLEKAREAAKVSGVLAFRDELMDMRDSVDTNSLSQANISQGQAQATRVERSLVTSNRPADSGGITTANLSRDTGGPALSAHESTRVESNIGSNSGKRKGKKLESDTGGRSDESIRRIMDRNKGAIFAVYNRALRRDPLLEGKLVFEMVIAASGEITELTLLSSELHDTGLTDRILSRIRMIRFDPEQVQATRVNYSFDFLPYS